MRGGDRLVGVLALQGDVREHEQVLQDCGARTTRVRTAETLASVDALVIPGGESTTMVKLARIFDLLEPLLHRLVKIHDIARGAGV